MKTVTMHALRKRYGKDKRAKPKGLATAREAKDERETDEFELFLAAQDYAKSQLETAEPDDKQYWQGVKDGLRKCYAIFTNDPGWEAVGGGSPQDRPTGARQVWKGL